MMKKIRLALIVAVLSVVATGLLPSNLSAQTNWVPEYQFLAAGSSAQFNTVGIAAALPGAIGEGSYTACTNNGAGGYWTQASTINVSGMQVHDPRATALLDEPGTVWIAWDNNFISLMDYNIGGGGPNPPGGAPAAGNVANVGIICAYVSLDSVVGLREYFARGQMVLYSSTGAVDTQQVPLLPLGTPLPKEVVYYFDTLVFPDHSGPNPVVNVAATDILPWDGKFATIRAMGSPVNTRIEDGVYQNLGYGGLVSGAPSTCSASNPVGAQVKSAISTKYFQVADWAFDPGDVDPYTCLAARAWNMTSSGAAPVMVIANVTNTASGHLGDPAWTDPQINRYVLANVFSGLTEEVGSVTGLSTGGSNGLQVFQREPLSGTYNTFDSNITCSLERYQGLQFVGYPAKSLWPTLDPAAPNSNIAAQYYNCMETFVGNPVPSPSCSGSNPCANPLWLQDSGLTQAYNRKRVIGTSEMVKTVAGNADGIGYAFWGYSTVAPYIKPTQASDQIVYLPVDDIDPLYLSPSANPWGWGHFPECPSKPCANPPTFNKVIDGGYPIWTYYRWLYDPNYGTGWNNLLSYVRATATNTYFDLVPDTSMNVFRSHYAQLARSWSGGSGQYPSNGISTTVNPEPEYGGDMGGEVFPISSEVNYMNDMIRKGICSWIDIYDQSCEQTQWKQ